MISLSAFKAFPELPEIALVNGVGLELTRLVDPVEYPEEFISEIKCSKYAGMYNSAHGPFYDLIPPSVDSEIRNLCMAKFRRAIIACKKLSIKNLILHTGWVEGYYPDNIWIKNSIEFWSALLNEFDDEVRILIENVAEIDPVLIKEIVAGVSKSNFQICIDIGHANLKNKYSILHWVDELAPQIGHFHIHNNYGKEDNHNGIEKGSIDMKTVIGYIAKKCPTANFNLEIRTDFQESIDRFKEYSGIAG